MACSNFKCVYFLFLFIRLSCGQTQSESNSQLQTACAEPIVKTSKQGKKIIDRFAAPQGFHRENYDQNTFQHFLQNLPLKPTESEVLYYNGAKKSKQKIYSAVVDLPIGNKNLHQCADAIIRLRADYLKQNNREDEIAFHFTNGFLAEYRTWKSGKRISVNGNKVSWVNGNAHADNYWKYLETVFTYAGTLSLSKELKSKNIQNIQIGDVFIQGGSPGHAVIVVDLAVNSKTGEKLFMLAQSYMPAQEIQILNHPKTNSVWFSANFEEKLITPEWIFFKKDLKGF